MAAADNNKSGVQLHPVHQVVNVQWGGLAVIFGKQASNAPEQKKSK